MHPIAASNQSSHLNRESPLSFCNVKESVSFPQSTRNFNMISCGATIRDLTQLIGIEINSILQLQLRSGKQQCIAYIYWSVLEICNKYWIFLEQIDDLCNFPTVAPSHSPNVYSSDLKEPGKGCSSSHEKLE